MSAFGDKAGRMKRRRQLRPVAINPLVVDLSHHNDVTDFGKVKAAGYAGIIHKATEAIGFVDKMYTIRRGPAINAGLLWGAYHFQRPVSIPAQVDFFLKIAAPDNMTLLALDHEDERVPLIDAKEFLLRVEHAVGRKARVSRKQIAWPGLTGGRATTWTAPSITCQFAGDSRVGSK